jgi:hypothetical protein
MEQPNELGTEDHLGISDIPRPQIEKYHFFGFSGTRHEL